MSALAEQRSVDTGTTLRSVPSRVSSLGRGPFLLILAGVLAGGLVLLLMLQTSVQEQSFEVRQLQLKATELGYKQAQLEAEVQQKSTPAEIARQASGLGMVPNPYGVYIDVRTGSVLGTQKPVSGREVPYITYKTSEQIAAEKKAPVTPSPAPGDGGDGTNQ